MNTLVPEIILIVGGPVVVAFMFMLRKQILKANLGFNYFEFTFDQFTGYSPLVYELSNILGANILNIHYPNRQQLSKHYLQVIILQLTPCDSLGLNISVFIKFGVNRFFSRTH